jgi:hypothetical protein
MPNQLRKMGRYAASTGRRVTGISTPFGGIQWSDPGPSDTEIVRKLLLFLEDKRALYSSFDLEIVSQVEYSLHQIRDECTKALQLLPKNAFASMPIRAIRQACRCFHDEQIEDFRL